MSRIHATSQVSKLEIELDVNTDIYPMEVDGFYSMVLASSINADGSEEFDVLRYEHQGGAGVDGHGSLLDKFDYVMHGKIFKYTPNQGKM